MFFLLPLKILITLKRSLLCFSFIYFLGSFEYWAEVNWCSYFLVFLVAVSVWGFYGEDGASVWLCSSGPVKCGYQRSFWEVWWCASTWLLLCALVFWHTRGWCPFFACQAAWCPLWNQNKGVLHYLIEIFLTLHMSLIIIHLIIVLLKLCLHHDNTMEYDWIYV